MRCFSSRDEQLQHGEELAGRAGVSGAECERSLTHAAEAIDERAPSTVLGLLREFRDQGCRRVGRRYFGRKKFRCFSEMGCPSFSSTISMSSQTLRFSLSD